MEDENILKLITMYDSVAEKYDSFAAGGQYKCPIWLKEKLLDLDFPKPKILDLGCANGYLGKLAKEIFKTSFIWGVDVSPKMIEELKKGGLYDNSMIWDLNNGVPFTEAEVFDIVFAFGVFEFIKNPIIALKGISKTMKIQGRLFASFECYDPEKNSEKTVLNTKVGIVRYLRSIEDVRVLLKEAMLEIISYDKIKAYKSPSTGAEIDYFVCEIKRDRNI
ncbi:MAG: class I SAM-dependent methyltransferase [Elusimicrobiota bacterium]|nr:class I SAM-dependent methyltransferase [Elusimicrobiota bacterium]